MKLSSGKHVLYTFLSKENADCIQVHLECPPPSFPNAIITFHFIFSFLAGSSVLWCVRSTIKKRELVGKEHLRNGRKESLDRDKTTHLADLGGEMERYLKTTKTFRKTPCLFWCVCKAHWRFPCLAGLMMKRADRSQQSMLYKLSSPDPEPLPSLSFHLPPPLSVSSIGGLAKLMHVEMGGRLQ